MSSELFEMSPFGRGRDEVFRLLGEAEREDVEYDSGRVFNTNCTEPHPLALEAFMRFAGKNTLKEQHGSLRILERRVIQMLGRMLHNPFAAGYVGSGGTDANLAAFITAKNRNPHARRVLVSGHTHYSKLKLKKYLDLEVVEVPTDREGRMLRSELEKRIDGSTLAVFATAGTTTFGVIDPIRDIAEIKSRKAPNMYLHVDAANGGYFLPFKERLGHVVDPWDFRVDQVDSIALDPHKLGRVPLGAGVILFRDQSCLRHLEVHAGFPPKTYVPIQGSRSGGGIAATYAMLMHYGLRGYMTQTENMMARVQQMAEYVERTPELELVAQPEMHMIGITTDSPTHNRGLLSYLRCEGYKITPLGNHQGIRLVMNAHVLPEHVDDLTRKIAEGLRLMGAGRIHEYVQKDDRDGFRVAQSLAG